MLQTGDRYLSKSPSESSWSDTLVNKCMHKFEGEKRDRQSNEVISQ